jgi:hypothetical protein
MDRTATCACGQVQFKATGEPILTAVCYCDNCQAGAKAIEALPNATPVRDAFGGSPYVTCRADRWACIKGENLLRGLKLSEAAPTTRYVATCCNSGMYLKYGPGWWISAYRARFADPPPLMMRTQTKFVPEGVVLPKDVPIYPSFPFALVGRLMRARVAMWLGL